MKIHFIGIGGKGMLPLAILASKMGHEINGSDLQYKQKKKIFADHEVAKKFIVFDGHQAEHIASDTNLIVKSANIPDQNPEILEAKRRCLPVFGRLEMLGKLLRLDKKCPIGIMGTFGKTTTTALLGHVLKKSGLNPMVYAGGEVQTNLGHSVYSKSKYALVEMCEYKGEMFRVDCGSLIITNIEKNHLDYYGSLDNLYQAFENYIALNVQVLSGHLFICNASLGSKKLIDRFPHDCVSYGFTKADWTARDIIYRRNFTTFAVYDKERVFGSFKIPLVGRHNVLNALAAIVIGHHLGLTKKKVGASLAVFKNLRQRCEETYADKQLTIIDDNARLPLQVECTVDSIRQKYPDRSACIIAGIWGRLNKRELDEYAGALNKSDLVLLAPIGENAKSQGGAEDDDADYKLTRLLNQNGKQKAFAYDQMDQFLSILDRQAKQKPLSVVLLGYEAYRPLLSQISNQILSTLHAH